MMGVNPLLMSWLMSVSEHSKSSSRESEEVLVQLSQNIPDFDPANIEICCIVKKVQEFARKKTFDPELSPTTKNAITNLSERAIASLSPIQERPKPRCARKLVFSSSESSDEGV